MAHTKNKHSSNLHASRHRIIPQSRPTPAKKLILIIIFCAGIIVIIAVLCSIFLNTENLVKSRIASLASDYYENYLYTNFSQSEAYQSSDDHTDFMSKYETYGFTPVTLRQLLLYDNQKNAASADFLDTNCDTSATYVKFYAAPPYGQHDYRVDYTYSCNF